MNDMIKQAQKMQDNIAEIQAQLETKEYEVAVGGGAIKVVINGKKEITSFTIKPEVVDPEDIEMLQDLIISAVNEGIRVVEKDSDDSIGAVTGGLNLPF